MMILFVAKLGKNLKKYVSGIKFIKNVILYSLVLCKVIISAYHSLDTPFELFSKIRYQVKAFLSQPFKF